MPAKEGWIRLPERCHRCCVPPTAGHEISSVSREFQAGELRRPRLAAGVGPLSPEWSVGRAGVVAQAGCRFEAFKRVLARRVAKRRRDLPAPRDSQLRAQDVGVRLRRSRRDTQPLGDLHIRATLGDQLDDLPLPRGELDAFAESSHGPRSCRYPSRAAIGRPADFPSYAQGRMNEASWPRALTAASSVSSSAPACRRSSSSSRRCVRIISGPSVAMV